MTLTIEENELKMDHGPEDKLSNFRSSRRPWIRQDILRYSTTNKAIKEKRIELHLNEHLHYMTKRMKRQDQTEISDIGLISRI